MEKIYAESPFEKYILYIYIKKDSGRKLVILRGKDCNNIWMSYARYLMSVKLNRKLDTKEQVDHIDNDKTNDDISNLQILTASENLQKYHYSTPEANTELNCCNCGNKFTILKIHLDRAKNHCCSRICRDEFAIGKPKLRKVVMLCAGKKAGVKNTNKKIQPHHHGTPHGYKYYKCKCRRCMNANANYALDRRLSKA